VKFIYALLVSLTLAILLTISHMILKYVSVASTKSGIDFYIDNAVNILFALLIYLFVFLVYPYVLRFFSISLVFPIYTGLSIVLVMV